MLMRYHRDSWIRNLLSTPLPDWYMGQQHRQVLIQISQASACNLPRGPDDCVGMKVWKVALVYLGPCKHCHLTPPCSTSSIWSTGRSHKAVSTGFISGVCHSMISPNPLVLRGMGTMAGDFRSLCVILLCIYVFPLNSDYQGRLWFC